MVREVKGLKGLVFDNPNSSTVQYMNQRFNIIAVKTCIRFKTNEEIVKFIAENEGMIGFVGLNYLYQPQKLLLTILKY
jgi:phosphate transport system substrate-binding protein